MSWKSEFTRFAQANPGQLHFAAHSHHFWPDVTFEAQQQVWLDAASDIDQKWGRIFENLLPRAQELIAQNLGLRDPRSIAFAGNTHELLLRLASCVESAPLRILTSDSEFHSFARQAQRWEEAGQARVERIATEPFGSFEDRFLERARAAEVDLVYLSHVCFNSGFVFERLTELAEALPETTLLVLDGYHSFMALPFDLAAVEDRAFYISGGYKYAMAGEGCCFMHCPDGYGERPVNTGWYSVFGDLQKSQNPGAVPYARDGMRFLGSTFDPSGLYRMVAALGLWQERGVSVQDIHDHVVALQSAFLEAVGAGRAGSLRLDQLKPVLSNLRRGHFLTFERPDAGKLHTALRRAGVVTDVRGDRIRFGFGLYQDLDDVEELGRRIAQL